MQPQLQVLSLHSALAVWLICALFLFVIYFFQYNQNQQLEAEFAELNAQNKQQTQLVENMLAELGKRQNDQKLLDKIEQKLILVRLKRRVVNELSGQENLKSNGFSQLMLDLANNHESGLWLTRISLNERKSIIQGSALESASIPKWVNKLGLSTYFKGQNFASTRLYRDEQQQLFFILASDYSDAKNGTSTNE
jgi:Ca2+/Na+ antiporter